ncbi:hypothetical protein Dimus_022047 [Dionaea muscipula]
MEDLEDDSTDPVSEGGLVPFLPVDSGSNIPTGQSVEQLDPNESHPRRSLRGQVPRRYFGIEEEAFLVAPYEINLEAMREASIVETEPRTFEEAVSCPTFDKWLQCHERGDGIHGGKSSPGLGRSTFGLATKQILDRRIGKQLKRIFRYLEGHSWITCRAIKGEICALAASTMPIGPEIMMSANPHPAMSLCSEEEPYLGVARNSSYSAIDHGSRIYSPFYNCSVSVWLRRFPKHLCVVETAESRRSLL